MRMLDSIYPQNLPDGADAYLGYVDGHWPTFAALKARFPRAHLLRMAVFARDDADGCDCEAGDLTVTQVPAWVRRQITLGAHRPVVYASASIMGAVVTALRIDSIDRMWVRLLSAHYTHEPHICGPASCRYPGVPACDGTQWTDQAAGLNGSRIDESLLLPDFFGGDMPLTPADVRNIWTADGIVDSPTGGTANPFWSPAHVLTDAAEQARAIRKQVTALTALVSSQAGVDTDAIIAGVLKGLDPAQLAASIATSLGPDVGQQVLAALQAALAKASQ